MPVTIAEYYCGGGASTPAREGETGSDDVAQYIELNPFLDIISHFLCSLSVYSPSQAFIHRCKSWACL